MEQEPVYVPSERLSVVMESVLGRIYDHRQTESQSYIEARVHEYNQAVWAKNQKYSWLPTWLRKPEPLITPHGMEIAVLAEMQELADINPQACAGHPMVQINNTYAEIEHQAKDAIIQCAMNESVLVSADMVRGVSHFGLPLDFCKRRRIGF